MRQLGSYLIILLFITAYGRCIADQLGSLHQSGAAACCQTNCSDSTHCTPVSDCTDQHEHDTSPSECPGVPTSGESHPHNHGGEESPDPPTQAPPCQLCIILDSDSIIQADPLKVPSPLLTELNSLLHVYPPLTILHREMLSNLLEQDPAQHPLPPAEQRSKRQRIDTRTTPVRGPSLG